jgi:transposase
MLSKRMLEQVGGWDGYRVERVDYQEGRFVITLKPRRKPLCSRCGRICRSVHETTIRRIRDLPLFDRPVVLSVPVRRGWCEHCGGPQIEAVSWLGRRQRVTKRLAEAVGELCALLPIQHVARFYKLDWHTVKAIDKAALERRFGEIDLSEVSVIAMDEFALHRGHRYATVVYEPSRGRVLWVGRGRSREAVRPFFELLGTQGCARIRAVAMDMNTAFDLEVRAHCPNAEVVYDLFHVIAKYAREVIDRVRVDQANRLRDDTAARKAVKGSRWLLLKNADRLKPHEHVRLTELLDLNRPLWKAYVLRDDLRELWRCRDPKQAERQWASWYRRALSSRVAALKLFARRLKPYVAGILAHARWPLHTSVVEGVNNRIKVIKRMAYGFRDEAYFFLKIKAAFPGIAR